jgi:hypothetical protein
MSANDGTLRLGAGVDGNIFAQGCGAELNNGDIISYVQGTEFTVDFTFKLTEYSNKYTDETLPRYTIFSIFNGDTNYIRLAADGTFYVNGVATNSSNKAEVSTTDFVRYTIVHNEYSTSLLVNDEYLCGAVNATSIPATPKITLGWCVNSPYTDYRITGDYGALSVSDSAIDTGDNQLLYDYANEAVTAYLAKMTDANVYRAMLPAYKAYVDLNEALDAVKYGQSTTAQVVAAKIALDTATTAMNSVWSATTASGASVRFPNDSSDVNSAYVKNLLYSDNATQLGKSDQEVHMYICAPAKSVALYNGPYTTEANKITIPVVFEFIGWWSAFNSNSAVFACYPSDGTTIANKNYDNDNTYFRLAGAWHGDVEATRYNSVQYYFNDVYSLSDTSGAFNYQNGQPSNSNRTGAEKSDRYRECANYIYYKGTSEDDFTDGLNTVPVYWFGFSGHKSENQTNEQHRFGQNGSNYTTGTQQYVYVINYVGVEDAVNNNKATLATVAQYKEGGLYDFISAMDELTLDGSNAAQSYSTNTATKAAAVAKSYADGKTHMASAIADNKLNTNKDSAKGYSTLRTAMDYSGSPTAIGSTNGLYGSTFSISDIIANKGYVTVTKGGVPHTVLLNNYSTFKTRYDEAVAVMAALGEADLNTNKTNNYTNSSGASTAATNLMAAFNALDAVFTVSFKNGAGAAAGSQSVEAGCTIAAGSVPSNSAPTDNNDDTHEVFSWPAEVTDNHEVWSTELYTETSSTGDCNHTVKQAHTAAAYETNGYYDYACSVCGHINAANREWDAQDWDAYNAEVANFVPEVKTEKKTYTETSLGNYSSAADTLIANVDTSDQSKSQAYIDSVTSQLITYRAEYDGESDAKLVYIPYNITCYKVVDGGEPVQISNAVKHYGDVTYLANNDGNTVVKWVADIVKTDGTTESRTFNTNVQTFSYLPGAYVEAKANGYYNDSYSATYTVYTTANGAAGESQSKVTLMGRAGNIADVQYFDKNASASVTVDAANYKITVAGTEMFAQQIYGYSVTGFRVGDTTLTSGTIDISSDVVIYPIYTYSDSSNIGITFGDGCYRAGARSSTLNTTEVHKWADQILVTADGANENTAWRFTYSNSASEIVAYGPSYHFTVSTPVTISCETGTPAPKSGLVYWNYGTVRTQTISVIGSFYVPDNVTNYEVGILFKNNADSNHEWTAQDKTDMENFCQGIGNVKGVSKRIATEYTLNQYLFNLSRSKNTAFSMPVITYLKYSTDGGSTYNYVFSDRMEVIRFAGE